MCAEAKKYVDQGFKAMKLRVGRGLAQDVECVSRVRQTVGPDVRIMVDANQGYSDRDAMKIIKKVRRVRPVLAGRAGAPRKSWPPWPASGT